MLLNSRSVYLTVAALIVGGILLACNKSAPQKNSRVLRLHDIWALKMLGDRPYRSDQTDRHPVLELYPEDRRVQGNDGCNQLMGSLAVVDDRRIEFGPLGGTKKMCRDMEIPGAFLRGLSATRSYRFEELHLILLDENDRELMRLLKVD